MASPQDLDWTRDELVLVLDLALRYGPLPASNARIERLSTELKALPIHAPELRLDNFRSPDAVSMKVGEFATLDPKWKTTASRGKSPAVAEVWAEFGANISRVGQEVRRIRGSLH